MSVRSRRLTPAEVAIQLNESFNCSDLELSDDEADDVDADVDLTEDTDPSYVPPSSKSSQLNRKKSLPSVPLRDFPSMERAAPLCAVLENSNELSDESDDNQPTNEQQPVIKRWLTTAVSDPSNSLPSTSSSCDSADNTTLGDIANQTSSKILDKAKTSKPSSKPKKSSKSRKRVDSMKKPAANPKKKREKSQKKKVSGLTWCDDSKSTSLKPTSVDFSGNSKLDEGFDYPADYFFKYFTDEIFA